MLGSRYASWLPGERDATEAAGWMPQGEARAIAILAVSTPSASFTQMHAYQSPSPSPSVSIKVFGPSWASGTVLILLGAFVLTRCPSCRRRWRGRAGVDDDYGLILILVISFLPRGSWAGCAG
jgi:hypothetical protein